MKPWKILKSQEILKTPFFKIVREECQRAQKVSEYYVIEKKHVVFCTCFTKKAELILIKQYRHPVRATDIEIPAGYVEEGEEIALAAKRELLEETGYESDEFIKIGETFTSAGSQNNYIHFFVGFNAEKTSTQNLDDLEEIEVFLSSVEEAEKFAAEGKMKDTGSVLALFLLKEYLKSN